MVPHLVVRALLTDESAHQALERAVLHDERVEGHSHTIAEHIEEVVTRWATLTGLLVTVVIAEGIVEVNVVELRRFSMTDERQRLCAFRTHVEAPPEIANITAHGGDRSRQTRLRPMVKPHDAYGSFGC